MHLSILSGNDILRSFRILTFNDFVSFVRISQVNEWTNTIVAGCLKQLQELSRPFKYVITSIIMQKNGAGLNTSSSQFWDANKDGMIKIPWSNLTMSCIVTVYGVAVNIDDPQELDM